MRAGAHSIEEGLIIAPQLNILQPHSVEQRVVGQIPHMVALMIRKVLLKQMEARVDLLRSPSLLTIRWIAPMPPQLTALAFGHLIMNNRFVLRWASADRSNHARGPGDAEFGACDYAGS